MTKVTAEMTTGLTRISSVPILSFDGTNVPDKTVINFADRDTVGDGGGGPLRFLKGSTATADGVTVYTVTGGRLVREGWPVFGIDVRWAGAKGDGVTDDTVAVQIAINAAKAYKVSNDQTFGGGFPPVLFPSGVYIISSTLSVVGFNGFVLRGCGQQSTQIIFTGDAGTLFNWSTYLNCTVRDMSIFAGTVSIVSGRPTFVGATTKNSTAINFNSTSSGTTFNEYNVTYAYWGTVYRTKDSIVNGDNHRHFECSYYQNEAVWDNTNTQAVVWSFIDCLMYSNSAVLKNPGVSTLVRGGDQINKGDFLTVGLTNTSLGILIDGVNFENYQNLDPTSTPRFIVGTGNYEVEFRNCTGRGGGTLAGKTSGTLSGLFNVKINNCYFTGTWDVTVTSSSSGFTSSLCIENCPSAPYINQIVQSGQGNKPINLIYKDHRVGGSLARINRNFIGALSTAAAGTQQTTFTDVFVFEAAALNAATLSKSCAVFVPSPYIVQLVGVEIDWINNTTNTVVIDVWESSAKVTKLATVTTTVASGAFQNFEIPLSGILARYQVSSTSAPLHVEFTAAGNAGSCKARVGLKFRQVSF